MKKTKARIEETSELSFDEFEEFEKIHSPRPHETDFGLLVEPLAEPDIPTS